MLGWWSGQLFDYRRSFHRENAAHVKDPFIASDPLGHEWNDVADHVAMFGFPLRNRR